MVVVGTAFAEEEMKVVARLEAVASGLGTSAVGCLDVAGKAAELVAGVGEATVAGCLAAEGWMAEYWVADVVESS